MKVIFMGTPEFAVPILEMLNQEHEVLLVVTQPDKEVGRKRVLTPSPVKIKAVELGLPIIQLVKLKQDYAFLLSLNADFIVTAAYGQMLPNELLDKLKAINVHGSLLPAYRGGAPIQYALFDGLKETGVTIMYMAYKMDSGDIIKQEKLWIEDDDNYLTLAKKLSILGTKLLKEVLMDLSKGMIYHTKQDESQITYAYTLKTQDEWIHFNETTKHIINRIRGLSPQIGATAAIKNTTLKFYLAQKSDIIDDKAVPGTVLSVSKRLVIKTKDGSIEMLLVQAPGKKIMAVKDFLNGQNIIALGDVFEEGSSSNGR